MRAFTFPDLAFSVGDICHPQHISWKGRGRTILFFPTLLREIEDDHQQVAASLQWRCDCNMAVTTLPGSPFWLELNV